MNKDVPENAFSSDSTEDDEVAIAGEEIVRYNNKNSSYFITSNINLFIIVGCDIQNARICMICYFRS